MPAKERKQSLTDKLNTDRASLTDEELLELLLLNSHAGENAKNQATELLKAFGSLNGVLSASPAALEKCGISADSALLIALSAEIERQIGINEGNRINQINSAGDAIAICKNMLGAEPIEKMIIISIDANGGVIKTHTVSSLPTVKDIMVNPQDLLINAIYDNACSIVVSHNHPHGAPLPSNEDVDFTVKAIALLKSVGIELLDHIIIGEGDALSLRSDDDYCEFFK